MLSNDLLYFYKKWTLAMLEYYKFIKIDKLIRDAISK